MAERERAAKKFIQNGDVPAGALTWTGAAERRERTAAWRRAIWLKFPLKARILKIAWCLEALFQHHGYAFASNPYLMGQTGMPRDPVERALTALEDIGAIIRVHVFTAEGLERRIFPARGILSLVPAKMAGSSSEDAPAKVAGWRTRQGSRKQPAKMAGQNRQEGNYRLSATQIAARKAAELREDSIPDGHAPQARGNHDGDV